MLNKLKNVAWLLIGAVALFWAASTFVGMVFGGDLDPPGPPGSTMKTLDEIPPSWSQKLLASDGTPCNSSRFRCVLDDEAVLDLETGLVWERLPPGTQVPWQQAINSCANRELGGRKGWRLTTQPELNSLIDRTQSNPALPSGHPFQSVQNASYWTATSVATNDGSGSTSAHQLALSSGNGFGLSKTTAIFTWCVRGATGGYGGGY